MPLEPFLLRALLAALILAPLCGMLGVFVTARRMAFIGDTIAHAALAGIALSFWWGFSEPTLPLLGFCLLVAVGILWLKEKTDLMSDTIMALLLSGSVSLGIVILSLLKTRRGDLHRYLFGDILAVSSQDVWLAAVLLAAGVLAFFLALRPMTLLTVNEDLAHVCGVRVRRLEYLFVLGLTVTVVLSLRLLGIILVTSLLVIPAATARNLSRTLRQQILLSVLTGLAGGGGGTLLAWHLDLPCGASIVLVCLAFFLVSVAVRRLRGAT